MSLVRQLLSGGWQSVTVCDGEELFVSDLLSSVVTSE